MFYQEQVIDGVLMCRSDPDGEWRPVSPERMTERLVNAEAGVKEFERRLSSRPESGAQCFSLRHLQKHLPWTIPYSAEFEASYAWNRLRRVGHDVLHVMKSLGRIAAEVEAADHGRPRKLTGDALAKEAADLVLCALHIAKVEGFDLHDAVVKNSEARNAATIPPERRAGPSTP